jgi:HD-GYP domain-containing protein (c-di-GMP phosphodiesterase class II)
VSSYLINLHEAIYSLSDALDLVGVTHIHHGKRVAYMAAECGKHLGWSKAQLDELFQAAILHDSGVSKTAVHAKLAQLQWEEEGEHCHLGSALMSSSPVLQRFAPVVLHHHTHWSELKSLDLPLEVKLNANCIYMVDRVDILTLKYLVNDTDILIGKESIRKAIADKRGEWFCPELVDAFMEVSFSEAFWFSLEANNINGYVSTWLSETNAQRMSFEELRSLVSVFSRIVDAKSTFTQEHSDGVANLSRHLGELFSLPETNCEMLELAGLLHDIGKLRIPDELLEKPGRLTEAEIGLMRRHSFDTYNILKNITGLEQVALWAAHHHERVDGSGYPYRINKDELSLEARIIEVADVFQALAQRRPYREPLPPEQILDILKEQVAKGKLDADVVGKVDADLYACWQAAVRKREGPMAPALQEVYVD